MGFFDSLKNNLTGGGVKININAPAVFNITDTVLPVEVTFTSAEPRTVKDIEYRLTRHAKDAGRRDHEAYDFGGELKPYAVLKIEEPFQVSPSSPVIRRDQLTVTIPDEIRAQPINPRRYDVHLSVTAMVDGAFVAATALHVMSV